MLVIEAKHPDLKFRPRDIGILLMKTFVGSVGRLSDVARAHRKVEGVERHLEAVLRSRGIEDSSHWTVRGALVTPYGSPLAAWRGSSPLPVVFVEELAAWIKR